jgi:hypothetical protein
MPIVSQLCLFCAAFIASYMFGEPVLNRIGQSKQMAGLVKHGRSLLSRLRRC